MSSLNSDGILIGQIKYANVWPIFHGFDPAVLSSGSSIITEVPSVLNQRMLEGTLDISPVSSFTFATGADRLLLLPDLSVGSDGPVNSIFLFSRKPPEQIRDGVIALTNTSATSVHLLKMIMEKAYEGEPTYWHCPPNLDMMMERSDAALLIGDHAIQASWQDHSYIVTDLGEVWKQWTGYGMTFAVWAVQRSFAESNPELVAEIYNLFVHNKQRNLHYLQPLVERAVASIGGTHNYWSNYFKHLCYDFDDRIQAGLNLYFSYAYELGFIEHEVTMNIWNDKL